MKGVLVAGLLLVGCAADIGAASLPITGGRPATEADLSATVAVRWRRDATSEEACSGTLVTPRLVVTAAHCVTSASSTAPRVVEQRAIASEVRVIAGALDAGFASPDETYFVARVVTHPAYPSIQAASDLIDASGIGRDDDIALLELEREVTQLVPVPVLPTARTDPELPVGGPLVVAGYGFTAPFGDPTAIQGVAFLGDASVVQREATEMLTGPEGRADSCSGDSGGPVYLDAADGRYLVGTHVRARLDAAECGGGGIAALTPFYVEWLEAEAGVPLTELPAEGCAVTHRRGIPPWTMGFVGLALLAARRRLGATA